MKKHKKEKGHFILQISVLYVLIFIFILSMCVFTKYKLTSYGVVAKNALIATNLSVFSPPNLEINIPSENPDSNIIILKNPDVVLQTWEKNLKYNFSLDDNFNPKYGTSYIKSKMDISELIIYNVNVETGDVTAYTLNPSTLTFTSTYYPGGKGNIKTPKGNTVNTTCIYSKVGFTINVISSRNQYVQVSQDNGAYRTN